MDKKDIERDWIDNNFNTYKYKGQYLNTRQKGIDIYEVSGTRSIVVNDKEIKLSFIGRGVNRLEAMENVEADFEDKMKAYGKEF